MIVLLADWCTIEITNLGLILQTLVEQLAQALRRIDSSGIPFKKFQPGVGPYGEPQVVKKAVEVLKELFPSQFTGAETKRNPDVLIPGRWALEFKIVRPFGDNGKEAEHWSQNLLHPYPGNVSSIGDIMNLMSLKIAERKGVIVITYEHDPPVIDLEVIVIAFEHLAREVLSLPLGEKHLAELKGLAHPVHQQASVYGWEVGT